VNAGVGTEKKTPQALVALLCLSIMMQALTPGGRTTASIFRGVSSNITVFFVIGWGPSNLQTKAAVPKGGTRSTRGLGHGLSGLMCITWKVWDSKDTQMLAAIGRLSGWVMTLSTQFFV
jgi:hypothetical protein